jgi:adenylate cyclase class 2
MYEVELKLRADHAALRSRLEARGDPQGTVEQVDTYYDAPGRDFAETDEALRLRRETRADDDATVARLTYKGPLIEEHSKTRQEHETEVEDAESTASILESLGFSPAATVEKERTRYAVGAYTVTLDRVTGLGEFVEIEREAETIEPARNGAYDLCRDLGLDPADGIRTSYLGMLLPEASTSDGPPDSRQ